MRITVTIAFVMALAAVEGSHALQARTQAGGNTFTPVDLVNSFFHKGPKTHSEGEQQAVAATHAVDVEDLDALMDESEDPENLDGSAAGDDDLGSATDEVTQASKAESLDDAPTPQSRTKALRSKPQNNKKATAEGSQQSKGKAQKAQKSKKGKRGKNIPIIITIEPSGDMHLEVPNARIVKGRS